MQHEKPQLNSNSALGPRLANGAENSQARSLTGNGGIEDALGHSLHQAIKQRGDSRHQGSVDGAAVQNGVSNRTSPEQHRWTASRDSNGPLGLEPVESAGPLSIAASYAHANGYSLLPGQQTSSQGSAQVRNPQTPYPPITFAVQLTLCPVPGQCCMEASLTCLPAQANDIQSFELYSSDRNQTGYCLQTEENY